MSGIVAISCSLNHNAFLKGKSIVIPDICADTTAEYTLIHIIRGQECTECSVAALYQWNSIISMIDRKDFDYLFIVEMLNGDTPSVVQEALHRRPFVQPMFIDYGHEFLMKNKWLSHSRFKDTNDYLINNDGTVILAGDAMNDLSLIKYLHNLQERKDVNGMTWLRKFCILP